MAALEMFKTILEKGKTWESGRREEGCLFSFSLLPLPSFKAGSVNLRTLPAAWYHSSGYGFVWDAA